MSDSPIRVEVTDSIALVRWDDGKVNALGFDALEALHAALDQAEKEADAVLLVGRPGRFSAGFDLKTLSAGADSMSADRPELRAFVARLAMARAESPFPAPSAFAARSLRALVVQLSR